MRLTGWVQVGGVAAVLSLALSGCSSSSVSSPASTRAPTAIDTCISNATAGLAQLERYSPYDKTDVGDTLTGLMQEYGATGGNFSPVFQTITSAYNLWGRRQLGITSGITDSQIASDIAQKCTAYLTPSTTTTSTTAPVKISPFTGSKPALTPTGFGVVTLPDVGGGTQASIVAQVTELFGAPTATVTGQCGSTGGNLPFVEWGDLTLEFNTSGGFVGYAYTPGPMSGTLPTSIAPSLNPALKTTNGITLGSTVAQLTGAYPNIQQASGQIGGVYTAPLNNNSSLMFATTSTAPTGIVNEIFTGEALTCPTA